MALSIPTFRPADPAAQFQSTPGSYPSPTTRVPHHYPKDRDISPSSKSPRQRQASFSRKASLADISSVVYSLKRRSSAELGSDVSARLLGASHASLQEWIRAERMSQLPPEGSSYDRVLAWAQLFVERLHSFDGEIEAFSGDTYSAAQLAYGYCALMLDLGKENAQALMTSFGLFYHMSGSLVTLLERTEMFSMSQEIQEQLVLALSDLVTLVARVATYFHKAISALEPSSVVSVNIYSIFPAEIKAFVDRCDKVAESMWKHRLMMEGIDVDKVSDVKAIKAWVAPEDTFLANVVNSASHFAHDREELTCLWIAPHLTRFLKSQDKNLVISGKQGSGKTILASVIADYLQHPISGVTYSTVFVPINSRIPAEASSCAIAKSILSQLFARRIGNVQLLEALTKAYEHSQGATTDEEYDDIIWVAVADALTAPLPRAKELVLVVDGLDEASCGEKPIFQRLATAVEPVRNIRLITLGAEKLSPAPAASSRTSLAVTEDLIFDDVATVVRACLEHARAFSSQPELEQETAVTQIAKASQGSFLWAKLAAKRVLREAHDGDDNLRKPVDSLVSAKPSVTDLATYYLQSPGVSDGAKRIMVWLATSERPLSLKELTTLGSVPMDGAATVLDEAKPDLLATLRPINPLVFLDNGLAYLRHGLIRTAIIDVFAKGNLVPSLKDRHEDLAIRLLTYIKGSVMDQHDVSLTGLDPHNTNQLLSRYPLLDFAIHHWPVHARKTSIYAKEADVGIAKAFEKALPMSPTVPLLQWTLWQHMHPPGFLANQAMVTNIYRHLLTPNHRMTLQCIVLQAMLYQRFNRVDEAIPLLYEATTVAKTLLGLRHTTTMQLASNFIDVTSSRADSTSTDTINKRGEILSVLVECYRIQYGTSSEHVVSTLRLLAQHYQTTHQEHKAEETNESIRSITAGEIHEQEGGDLQVRLRKRREKHEAEGGVSLSLEVEERDEVDGESSHARDVELSLKRAEKYTAEGRLHHAEQTYIDVWQRACREYQVHHSDVWEERKMRAVLGYTNFLLSQEQRHDDVSAVLTSLWEDYKKRDVTTMTETLASLFSQVATAMKKTGLHAESLSILKHCAQYYQVANRTKSSVYQEIQESIRIEAQEVVNMVSSGTTSTMSESSSLGEMVLNACTSGRIDQTTLKAVFRLVELYTSQHRWHDTSRLIKQVLRTLWPSLLSPSDKAVTAPAKHTESCVDLAETLAKCYHIRRRPTKEGDVRMRVYSAMRTSRKPDDKLRDRVTMHLLRFLEGQSQADKLIEVRQEILDDYTDHYGPENPTVIKMLRELAELTRPRQIFVEYYQRLIRVLNKDAEIAATPEAFDLIALVANELWSRELPSDALPYHKMLFNTFIKQPKLNPKLQNPTFVRDMFERFTSCLKSVGTESSVMYKLVAEYRNQCQAIYGSTSSISVHATSTLAKVCKDSGRHEQEAIQLYEELRHTDSTEVDKEDIAATLDLLYEEEAHITASSSGSTSVSTAQVHRAAKIIKQRLEKTREEQGWAHEESLSQLSELTKLRIQQKQTDLLCSELQEATSQVLGTAETSSSQLMAAASTIASGYIAAGQVEKVSELQQEMYRQIMAKDTSKADVFGFDLSARGRDSLVFLAQLEHSLRRTSTTMTETLATLTTQYLYFQEACSAMKSESSSFRDVTMVTARLYQYLLNCERPTVAAVVFKDFTNYFRATEGKRVHLAKSSQLHVFLQTMLQHFSTHKSRDFIRSIGIAAHDGVHRLLKAGRYDTACDLAAASFAYISADDAYRHTPVVAKLVLLLGMAISGRDLDDHHPQQPDKSTRTTMLETASTIVRSALHALSDQKVSLEQISVHQLNEMIGLFGTHRDYRTLSWLLTILWNSRGGGQAGGAWAPATALALGRRYIVARYLVGDSAAAVRLAEDIVYNCRRVHGTRHPVTLGMSVLLAQLYTSVAQRYEKRNSREVARRYYKKSAGVHENILRVLTDPSYAEMEAGLDGSMGMGAENGAGYGIDGVDGDLPGPGLGQAALSEGQYARQHLRLLKHALERLGDWPKDYAEYERLNADVFRVYVDDLKGVEGVEKWKLSDYGGGKAESNDDLLDTEFGAWELPAFRAGERGVVEAFPPTVQ